MGERCPSKPPPCPHRPPPHPPLRPPRTAAQAEALYRRAVRGQESAPDAGHTEALAALGNLAQAPGASESALRCSLPPPSLPLSLPLCTAQRPSMQAAVSSVHASGGGAPGARPKGLGGGRTLTFALSRLGAGRWGRRSQHSRHVTQSDEAGSSSSRSGGELGPGASGPPAPSFSPAFAEIRTVCATVRPTPSRASFHTAGSDCTATLSHQGRHTATSKRRPMSTKSHHGRNNLARDVD